jgi:hypothetical protein
MTQYTTLGCIGKVILEKALCGLARKGKGHQGLEGDQNLTVTAPDIV